MTLEVAVALVLLGFAHGARGLAVASPLALLLAAGTAARGVPARLLVPARSGPCSSGAGPLDALGLTVERLRASSTLDGVAAVSDGDGRVLVLEVGRDLDRLPGGAAVLATLGGPRVRRAQIVVTTAPGTPAPGLLLALRCAADAAPGVLRRAVRTLHRLGVPATPLPAEGFAGALRECARSAPPAGAYGRSARGAPPVAGADGRGTRAAGPHQRCLLLRPRRSWGTPAPAPVGTVRAALAGLDCAATLAVTVERGGDRTGAVSCGLAVRLASRSAGDLTAAERRLRTALRSAGMRTRAAGTRPGLVATLPLAGAAPSGWAPPAAPGPAPPGPPDAPWPGPPNAPWPGPAAAPWPGRPGPPVAPGHPGGRTPATATAPGLASRVGDGRTAGPGTARPGGAGLALGTDRDGHPYRLALAGPRPVRLWLIGDRALAVALARVAATQGVRTRIHTRDPARWPLPPGAPAVAPVPTRTDPAAPPLVLTDAADHPPPDPGRCLLTVHTGGPLPARGRDTILIGRLPPDRVGPVAEALGLGAARHWLDRVPADMVAVVSRTGLRWIRTGTGAGTVGPVGTGATDSLGRPGAGPAPTDRAAERASPRHDG